MEFNNYSEKKRDLIRIEILDLKEIHQQYSDLIFVLSKVDIGVKSGRDSWNNYVTYFVYSPVEEVLNMCKQVHKIQNPNYGFLNEIKHLSKYGYSYTNSFDGDNPLTNDLILRRISEGILNFFLVEYKIFGQEVIDYYKLKLDLGLIYDSSSLIPTTRFEELLKLANFKGNIECVAYTKKNLYEKMLEYGTYKLVDKTEVHKLENNEQIMWLKFMFETNYFINKGLL